MGWMDRQTDRQTDQIVTSWISLNVASI